MRRLPIYLLVDVSGSMSGEPIESVKNGIQLILSNLRQDPQALETAFLSIITFESEVDQIVPLTELAMVNVPEISAHGGTSLGGALRKVTECAENEVQKSTLEQKGDWKPLVFILTDGTPTDSLEPGLSMFKKYKWGTVVACAAGYQASIDTLKQITDNVLQLDTADSTSISVFFKYVSTSISTSSKKIDSGEGESSELPPPPPEIKLV